LWKFSKNSLYNEEATQLFVKIKYILKSTFFCLLFTGVFVFFSFVKPFISVKFERLEYGLIGTTAALLITFLFLKIDKKNFADIGLKLEKATLKKFFAGIVVGAGIMGLMTIGVIYFPGFNMEANKNSNFLNFLFCTLPLIPLAFMEEVAFRVYPLILLKDNGGLRRSILITSILFALYHLANGWTIENSFLGAGVWGIVYGSAAIYSNGISMSTGLHYAANLTTSLFGATGGSFNIWILKQKDGSTLEHYQSSQLTILIPQITLLIVGVICMEWLVKNNNAHRPITHFTGNNA
jgi:hypothetical protein